MIVSNEKENVEFERFHVDFSLFSWNKHALLISFKILIVSFNWRRLDSNVESWDVVQSYVFEISIEVDIEVLFIDVVWIVEIWIVQKNNVARLRLDFEDEISLRFLRFRIES